MCFWGYKPHSLLMFTHVLFGFEYGLMSEVNCCILFFGFPDGSTEFCIRFFILHNVMYVKFSIEFPPFFCFVIFEERQLAVPPVNGAGLGKGGVLGYG